jgi:hypothetical protein
MKQKTMVLGGILALLFAISGCAGTSETGGGNLEMLLNEILEDASSTLNGIMSADQAMGANRALREREAELADVVKQSETASPDVQFQLTKIAREALPKFQEAAIRAMEIPGVADSIAPTVKSMTSHLTALL